ncbi:MAG TPA: DinB family protein [Tepidisphaeraceae bacterium]|nr:DinB family protein [Tepidisphaeraceae bacterium]
MERLSDIFSGWDGYNQSLINAIAPRSEAELAWRPSPAVRSMGELARHIALGRINWFVRMGAPGSADLAARISSWVTDEHGNRYIVEDDVPVSASAQGLVGWLTDTWQMIDRTLNAWTVADLSKTYRHVYRRQAYDVSRQWTLWRIMAHDIHHGGQIARILAERGIDAFELRALGGHVTEPPKAGEQQPAGSPGVDAALARPGGLSYLEIPATDPRRSAIFYEKVLGWRIENAGTDRPKFSDLTCHLIGRWVTDRPACREPGMLPFIYVDRIHEVVSRVQEQGGQIVKPIYPEGNLHVCLIRDPAGNVIGLWEEKTA